MTKYITTDEKFEDMLYELEQLIPDNYKHSVDNISTYILSGGYNMAFEKLKFLAQYRKDFDEDTNTVIQKILFLLSIRLGLKLKE